MPPESDSGLRNRVFRRCGLAGLALTLLLLIPPSLPLGIPGEWVWPRLAAPADLIEWLERGLSPLAAGLLVFGVAAWGDRKVVSCSRPVWYGLLSVLAATAICWQLAILSAAPSPQSDLRLFWVNYDPWATGYFLDAVNDKRSPAEFLSAYETVVAAGDVLHKGTHPPGLPLLNRLLLSGTRAAPRFSAALVRLADGAAMSAFRMLERQARLARPLTDPELAVLILLAGAALGCIAAIPVLIAVFVGHFQPRNVAWRAAVLSMSIPSVGVFLPRSDVYYAAFSLLLLLLIARGLKSAGWKRACLWGCFSGLWAFICMQTSLAHLPVLVAAMLWTLLSLRRGLQTSASGAALCWLGFCCMFALLVLGFGFSTGCRPWVVWQQNLSNHAGFYGQYPRTWWKWLLVNPLELGLAAGLPVVFLAVRATANAVWQISSKKSGSMWSALTLALATTWLLLLFSGKNQGEAARLWTLFTPWAVLSAATLLTGLPEFSKYPERTGTGWLLLLVCQQLVCVITVGRVSGYLQL